MMTHFRALQHLAMERFTRRRRLPLYAPVPRQDNPFGIAPHTDADFLTMLPQSEVDGLHIRPPGADWIKAPMDSNCRPEAKPRYEAQAVQ